MGKDLNIFLSNRLEVLYHQLKSTLFLPAASPLTRRLVVVYGPAMKSWLMLKMAQDPDLRVATGVEFVYLNQAFEHLLQLTFAGDIGHFPSLLELGLAIEQELVSVIQNYHSLSDEEQNDWSPLIHYLKLDPIQKCSEAPFSRKIEKRIIGLSQHLARLFQEYGRYAYQMVIKWEAQVFLGWQSRLWNKLFGSKTDWEYPARALQRKTAPIGSFTLHFFSISFTTSGEFAFLNRLAEYISVNYYLLSPCAVFWSDIRSDRENAYLQAYWQQKLGAFSPQVLQLDELLSDRNSLLANYGRLGREMAYQIEESQAKTHAHYVLPEHIKELEEESLLHHDLYLTETKSPLSLLHAIQADLLLMRNPQECLPFNFEEEQGSIQLHAALSQSREIEILYHNLLGLIAKDPSICPADIIVMAPQIADYAPYIKSIFGVDSSQLDFQILDLGMQMQSELVRGFLQLLELSESRWDACQLLQLFEHASFQRRHQLTQSDYKTIQRWIEHTGIRWGEDWLHRNELLQRSHCDQDMADHSTIGTWDYGVSRLLLGLTTVLQEPSTLFSEVHPYSNIDFSQGELLGKWVRLLHSLRDDLSPLHDRTQMTMEDWSNYLRCLLENYFQPNFENHQSNEDYEDLKGQFEILRTSTRNFKESLFSFASVKIHLLSLLQHRGMTYREDHLQAVRFCSLMPLRSIPAKVIVLLGMQEGAFPRIEHQSSLNLMSGKDEADYCPSPTDYDRYLFLEALHSAQDYFAAELSGI